ncbi:TPA: hypothetical protein EYP38_01390, partial [Candidatus Micrarchaeota archaeon]|nr:hypothetical protein [Candidatus Micrarchaeota archaeon]
MLGLQSRGESGVYESPDYVRISLAAAITLGYVRGSFYRGARLHCVNLLLVYREGCGARCAYCGLSRSRRVSLAWEERSFIRVDWPVVPLDDLVRRLKSGRCSHVERACVSMVTHWRARDDTLRVVRKLREAIDLISGLITPTIVDKEWL